MELCLHQVRGRAARLPVTLRQCTREEAETVYRLQNEVRAMMPNPELFMPDTLENIQSLSRTRPLPWRMGRRAAGSLLYPAVLRAQ